MGAGDVINFLEKNEGKEFTTDEIFKLSNLNFSIISIRNIVKKLLKDSSVTFKKRELSYEEKIEKYGHHLNARTFVYWLE